ncbi:hypothetical protein SEA_KARATE_5 [Microbacterium phage Karate]|nr:hypothetical protein SEA_KARATE_5 [Microbacterium phage Karate]
MSSSNEVEYKLAFRIERDNTVPVPLVQIGLTEDEQGKAMIGVVATNWAASDTGAQAVASLLRETADAIDRELGLERAEDERGMHTNMTGHTTDRKTARPRFNPQPRGTK